MSFCNSDMLETRKCPSGTGRLAKLWHICVMMMEKFEAAPQVLTQNKLKEYVGKSKVQKNIYLPLM